MANRAKASAADMVYTMERAQRSIRRLCWCWRIIISKPEGTRAVLKMIFRIIKNIVLFPFKLIYCILSFALTILSSFVSAFLWSSTKRPLNKCKACGYTWHPRGKDVSHKCPKCKSEILQEEDKCPALVIWTVFVFIIIASLASEVSTRHG